MRSEQFLPNAAAVALGRHQPGRPAVDHLRTAWGWGLALAWTCVTVWAAWSGLRTLRYERALARQDGDAAVRSRPDLSEGWLLRAQALLGTDPQSARQAAVAALARDPNDFQALMALAQADIILNDLDGASRTLQQAVDTAPGYEGHFQLASLERLRGNLAEFWRQTGLALRLVPDARVAQPLQQALRVAGTDLSPLLGVLPN